MDRRDLFAMAALGGGALMLAGGKPAAAQSAPASRLSRILEAGVLRVGTTGDFNPMSFRDTASNSYDGYDIEAMTKLAAELEVQVEWVAAEWSTITTGLAADRFDIFSGASVSVARARVAAFSQPYTEAGTVPLSLAANAERFGSWEAINQAGITVAVSMGTVFEEQARAHFPNATIQAVQSPATGFQEVLAGRADVTITSNVEAGSLVANFPDLKIVVPGAEMRNRRPFAYVVAQDDPIWLNFVNTWVTLRKIDGYFAGLDKKWLGQG
ncbi:transporter substrate-binding domain-containing protein [Xinfangfangia sp. CPCC 101601]|uniref:Transporter substrate-binding domain-containing protein n=1 Tax=Pseudogemmobacter lacusdianii TaxID=3069608 RepID=A0ABU0VWC2_9RHOB|nr:transporter substrate-binding domain-containing protein [Xinfangfangia sp. CPCC 101601]MDQ2066049.1 transporter substrate-binding domain-containing protein [Xinfangfangia sp. CPCC 101601]